MNQTQNIGELKSISELIDYKFFIPAYQRGYRWNDLEVEYLLNDVWDFIQTRWAKDKEECYCLQPLVVKKRNNDNKERNNDSYEVMDGQQRLTTIFLILQHVAKYIDTDKKSFEIEYETRSDSKEFLHKIKEAYHTDLIALEQDADRNIDYHHIYKACITIQAWFQNKADEKNRTLGNDFCGPFLKSVKFIWYEPLTKTDADADTNTDAVDIFMRMNVGKIPLTNAELIKAFLLNTNNSGHEPTLSQLKIAAEWDSIEYALQDPSLWYFVSKEGAEMPSHIELIFNLKINSINENNDPHHIYNEILRKYDTENTKKEDEEESIRHVHEQDDAKRNIKESLWEDIARYYSILYDWFCDHELYHKIGYLVEVNNNNPLPLLVKKAQIVTKPEFKQHIDMVEIPKTINTKKEIADLSFDDDKPLIKNMLLLHNIITIASKKAEYTRSGIDGEDSTVASKEAEYIRFPFYLYKEKNWDIDHVHARASGLNNAKLQIAWLQEAQGFMEANTELHQKITECIKDIKDTQDKKTALPTNFDDISGKIVDYFSGNDAEHGTVDHQESDDISNLVLLDSSTNRRAGASLFPQKRKIIISKDKEGRFIPMCTKQVFLKYYSDHIEHMEFWNQDDRQKYLDDIEHILSPYIGGKS